MDRLESRFSDSFACLQTLAGAVKELVPANTLDRYRTLFDYVHPREPIVNKALSIDSLQDNSTRYDLEEDNYFVSLGDRAKLMKCPDSTLNSGSELYSAMRNMNLVITTACSSLVIYVMDNLANAINLRNRYKQHVAEAQSTKNMSYEEIVNELGGVKQFLGVAGDDIEEWFRFVLTEEMSLTYFTRLLIKKHRKQMEKSYKSIAIGVMGAKLLDKLSDTPSDEFDYLQVICSIYFKIVFVVAGGKRSIRSDDMRFNVNPHDINNDVWLSRMVESPILSRICWIPYMLGMPLMASKSNLYSLKSKPLGFDEASEASGILREVFQAVGALPSGGQLPPQVRGLVFHVPFSRRQRGRETCADELVYVAALSSAECAVELHG
ncbi:hypothetical protein AGDE_15121 [Angomonas deanei]|uniref:Uncharacterized protein n=1 Tax=Angomonas deanei TaxID=59799 RepID=A0A7G2CN39_9TRYP|nr:hypothetical protein AGDE_15121 [Angomonas deanei]CAD2219622.1 hypothetical protein, conserved [Angomonas deanei]|eukprot:EPY19661.1 hypothetical protein AGDE_15121 [Angomonas deanei]